MPRIRTIKPEFWTDGQVVDLSPFARLLFIGTWNFAICDRGHVADDAKRLKMQVLPGDDIDPVELIDELLRSGRLERITAPDGRTYLFIKRFTDHQKIEKRWNPRCPACDSLGLNEPLPTSPNLPEPPARNGVAPRTSPNLPQSPPTSAQEGKGREGKGEKSGLADAIPTQKPSTKGTRLTDDWMPSEADKAKMRAECPTVDLKAEHAKFIDHWISIPGQKGLKLNWGSTWRNWMRNAASFQANGSKPVLTEESYSAGGPPAAIMGDPEAVNAWYDAQHRRAS